MTRTAGRRELRTLAVITPRLASTLARAVGQVRAANHWRNIAYLNTKAAPWLCVKSWGQDSTPMPIWLGSQYLGHQRPDQKTGGNANRPWVARDLPESMRLLPFNFGFACMSDKGVKPAPCAGRPCSFMRAFGCTQAPSALVQAEGPLNATGGWFFAGGIASCCCGRSSSPATCLACVSGLRAVASRTRRAPRRGVRLQHAG